MKFLWRILWGTKESITRIIIVAAVLSISVGVVLGSLERDAAAYRVEAAPHFPYGSSNTMNLGKCTYAEMESRAWEIYVGWITHVSRDMIQAKRGAYEAAQVFCAIE
jgi:hypothetical protein